MENPNQPGGVGPSNDNDLLTKAIAKWSRVRERDDQRPQERTASSGSHEAPEAIGAISAIETNLKSLEHVLLEDEVRKSRKVSEQHLRESLRYAKETLEATHSALSQETSRTRPTFNEEQVRATIRELGTEESWNQLLQSHNIPITDAVRSAVTDLIARISIMDEHDVAPESREALLGDIEFLHKEISRALHSAKGTLVRRDARELINAARRVATEVIVGLTATSVTAEFAGTRLMPDVVYTALGLTVASSLKELYRKTAADLLRTHSAHARLREYHRRLIRALNDLCNFLPWLERSNPPLASSLEVIRNVHLDTVFLVGCVAQLTIVVSWPGRDRYRGIIDAIRPLLDEVDHFLAGEAMRDINDLQRELEMNRDLLEGCSESINRA